MKFCIMLVCIEHLNTSFLISRAVKSGFRSSKEEGQVSKHLSSLALAAAPDQTIHGQYASHSFLWPRFPIQNVSVFEGLEDRQTWMFPPLQTCYDLKLFKI